VTEYREEPTMILLFKSVEYCVFCLVSLNCVPYDASRILETLIWPQNCNNERTVASNKFWKSYLTNCYSEVQIEVTEHAVICILQLSLEMSQTIGMVKSCQHCGS
jgi:hypothetical protein